ncbi:MAG: gliding motility-associated C-terminal domain-containing protein [Bacteroidetes bacterium]|nr:gliding motility-associated C-terminal domain-containing protein [Bacteroidota bacterium]
MVLLITFSSTFFLSASHLTGGRITYRYLGANKYEIKLSIYRDCSETFPFDNPAIVRIFNKGSNALVYNKALAIHSQSIIPPYVPNPCFIPPAGICLEIGVYIDTVQLANNASGYTITYQRCCRNGSVLNLVQPSQNGMTITTDIPPQINNTPSFINFPPIFICLTDTFNYSFASTDSDGDVLKYNLCSPLLGATNFTQVQNPQPPPYLPVIWSSTFSATNPIPNSGGITLNQNTGQFKFKPSMQGQYAIGICVEEYRNNVLINTNRLELQFNVVMCYLTSSIPTATNLCEGLTIPFQNNSSNANAFHWNFGDLSTSADTSNQVSPSYTYPNYGTYTVCLTVYNTAYGFCKDSSKKVINVNPLLSPTLQPTYSSCFKNNNFNFNVGGSFHPSANFNWNFTTNSSSPNNFINNTSAYFTTPTSKTISVIVNQFGCKDTLYSTVTFTNPTAFIDDFNLNCNDKNLIFENLSEGATTFFWNFGDPTSNTDTSSLAIPSYTYPSFGTYTISLIAFEGICSDTMKTVINVFPKLQINNNNVIQEQCFKNNSFNFVPTGIWSNTATFNWSFGNNANPNQSNLQIPPSVNFTTPNYHVITYSVSENGCTKKAQAVVKVKPSPKAIALLSDSSGCEPMQIKFAIPVDSNILVQPLWIINTNTFVTDSVIYPFNNSGIYSYSLIVTNNYNCTDTLSKANYIQINPTPKVKSFVNPFYTSILDPRINFIDSTTLTHNTNYSFGDGATSTQTNTIYSYQSSGEFNYSLIVSTQYGCADTASGIIYIDDIPSNYVPNVFTPNNDGVNDNFFIKGKNITNSSMQIINRWGTTVYNSSDALIGWNGINQNNNAVAADGVYFYIIEITLGNNRTYKFNGNVTLLR